MKPIPQNEEQGYVREPLIKSTRAVSQAGRPVPASVIVEHWENLCPPH